MVNAQLLRDKIVGPLPLGHGVSGIDQARSGLRHGNHHAAPKSNDSPQQFGALWSKPSSSSHRSVQTGLRLKNVERRIKKATRHTNQNEGLIFEKSSPGKRAFELPPLDVPAADPAKAAGRESPPRRRQRISPKSAKSK